MKTLRNAIMFLLLFAFLCPAFAVDGLIGFAIDDSCADKWDYVLDTPIYYKPDSVNKGQLFSAAIFVSEYKTGKDNNIKVNFDFKITGPDGKSYGEGKDVKAIEVKMPAGSDPHIILMSRNNLGIVFEEKDKFGKYIFEVTLKDLLSGSSKTLKETIECVKYESKGVFKTDEDLGKWMNEYYKFPKPEEAVNALMYFVKTDTFDGKSPAFLPLIHFFSTVFSRDKFLLTELHSRYNKEPKENQSKIIMFLSLVDGTEQAEKYKNIKKENFPDPYGDITEGSQLDMLWSEFMASGKIKPIQQIVNALELVKYSGKVNAYKDSKKTDKDKDEAILDAVYQSAVWSIGSNCEEHRLVKSYCEFLLQSGKLTAPVKAELGKILKEVNGKIKQQSVNDGLEPGTKFVSGALKAGGIKNRKEWFFDEANGAYSKSWGDSEELAKWLRAKDTIIEKEYLVVVDDKFDKTFSTVYNKYAIGDIIGFAADSGGKNIKTYGIIGLKKNNSPEIIAPVLSEKGAIKLNADTVKQYKSIVIFHVNDKAE